MSFSKLLIKSNAMFCLRNGYKNQQNFKLLSNYYLSSNTIRFYSLCTSRTYSFVDLKSTTKLNNRWMSSFKSDTTISFEPKVDKHISQPLNNSNDLDLSDFVVPEVPHSLGETKSQIYVDDIDLIDIPITALGIASDWTPVGWALHVFEFLNQSLPWWGSIALTTLVLRICMFPLVIKAQRNAAKMNAILPQMQLLTEKQSNARLTGNSMEYSKYSLQLKELLAKNGVSPFKSLLVPMAQAPIFITLFITLRRMANFPIESMKTGGILWFTDLTVPDPYYLLPILTCVSLWGALELGVESGMNPGNMSVIMKSVMRAMPVITFIFVINFPTALLTYWFTTNTISLLQVLILKQKPVRKFLNLPQMVKYNPNELPVKPKKLMESIKEAIDNAKVAKRVGDRRQLDEINFKREAIGPIKKTYKYDPTKLNNKN